MFARSLEGLEQLASTLEFDLFVAGDPVTGRGEAELAAACAEAEADFVLLQHGSFAMGDTVLPFADRDLRLGLWATAEPTKEGPILLNNFVSMNLAAGILGRYLGPRPVQVVLRRCRGPLVRTQAGADCAGTTGADPTLAGPDRTGGRPGHRPSSTSPATSAALRERLGTEVSAHELGELYAGAQAAAPAEVDSVVAELHEAARGRVEVSPEDMRTSARIYLALRALATAHGYHALAVSDWPGFQSELAIHPGLAFSWLDEHDGDPGRLRRGRVRGRHHAAEQRGKRRPIDAARHERPRRRTRGGADVALRWQPGVVRRRGWGELEKPLHTGAQRP